MPTAYLAAEGFEAQFEAERPDARLLHGRLYISEAAHPSAWAANIWHDCVELPVESVGKAAQALRDAFGGELKDALFVLERLRSIKTPDELKKLKYASEAVIESMKAVIANHGPGSTKAELVEALRREETNRGLTFEYCLITAGTSLNRAPSEQVWGKGDILSLDSGGNYHGYIGDLCRMAIHGEPDAELEDMLAEIGERRRVGIAIPQFLLIPELVTKSDMIATMGERSNIPRRGRMRRMGYRIGSVTPTRKPTIGFSGLIGNQETSSENQEKRSSSGRAEVAMCLAISLSVTLASPGL